MAIIVGFGMLIICAPGFRRGELGEMLAAGAAALWQ